MTITTRRVTGPIALLNGEIPANGRVKVWLSGWDREDGQAIVTGPTIHQLDDDGAFDAYLWCTDQGENGRHYIGEVAWFSTATGRVEVQPITFDVQTGVGSQPFAPSWVVGDLPESTQADALVQCLAAASGAAGSATAASAAATAAASSAAIALAGSPYRLPSFASLSSRLKYSGATGSQINVAAGSVIDVPGVGVYQVLASGASGAHLDYTGSGGVKLAVLPLPTGTPVEAFGAVQGPTLGVYTDSAAAIQKALDWSAGGPGRVVYFSGDYAIGTTLNLAAAASVMSDRNAIIRPMTIAGPSTGIISATGTAVGATVLPQLHLFTGYGLVIRGTDVAKFVVPQFHSCGCAVQIAATAGDTNVLDTAVEFDAIANCGCALEVSSSSGSDVIQGLLFRGNFITETQTVLRRVGVACADDGPLIDVAAVDITTGGGALCDNQISSHFVPRTTVKIGTWLGGAGFVAGTPTQLFKGLWDNAAIDVCDAQLFDQTNLTPDLVRSSSWKTRNGISLGGAPALVPLGTALSSFNGGKMLWPSDFVAKVTLWSSLAAGASVAASFFHVLADGYYQRWIATMQQGASGVIIEAVHDQSATVPGRVAVVIRNVSGSAIASGTTIYMAIKRV